MTVGFDQVVWNEKCEAIMNEGLFAKEWRKLKEAQGGIIGKWVDEIFEAINPETQEKFLLFYNSYLSNFYPSEFELEGLQFVNNEQYFHYKKAELFRDEVIMQEILAAKHPRTQKQLGQEVKGYDDTLWNEKRQAVMKDGLFAKFSQNEHLKSRLISTVGSTLVEASPFDKIWGIGIGQENPLAIDKTKWKGQNLLGEILMQIRDELVQ